MTTSSTSNSVGSAPDAIAKYLKTYLETPPPQDATASPTDAQLNGVMLMVKYQMQQRSSGGIIIDIGCGKGILLDRLLKDASFTTATNWIYVGIDSDDNLDAIQRMARGAGIARRVEPKTIDDFYKNWPIIDSQKNQITFCRNVLHELTIAETAQLFHHVAINSAAADVFICQDLMNFPEGERHNACWFPAELETCLRAYGFSKIVVNPSASKSGARWFDIIAEGRSNAVFSREDSKDTVLAARVRQWEAWSEINKTAQQQILQTLDLDLQLAALTRQLWDAGTFCGIDSKIERRIRSRELVQRIDTFVKANNLDKSTIADVGRMRERGEQMNLLESFLRSEARLAVVVGGGGSGKTTLVKHLLATRSYEKSPVIVDAKQALDLWGFLEQVFAQIGLRLVPERLSVLNDLGWNAVEVPLRQFVNNYASRIILFIDNIDAWVDTNGAIQNRELASTLAVLVGHSRAKMIVSQRSQQLVDQLTHASGNLKPPVVHVGRYSTDQTVVNILDDRFNRAAAGLEAYPSRLIRAIDRHPLGAMLASEILHKNGIKTLKDERFFLELEQRLHRELWSRLVDDKCSDSVRTASELRIPIPREMLEELSHRDSVVAGLESAALFVVKDHRWDELLSTLAVFRKRHVDDSVSDESIDDVKHGNIADSYLQIYQRDDDPKWIRESYYHRMLAGGINEQALLGQYYFQELLASANYRFRRKDYRTALELYDAAAKHNALPEEVKMHRASCRVRVHDRPAGDSEFHELIKAYPSNKGIRSSYVDALIYIQEFATAKQKLEEFSLMPEDNDWIMGQWGRVWLGLNEYKKAETLFRKQLGSTALPHPRVFIYLSRALQYQGAASEALNTLERGHKLHPLDLTIITSMGASLERLRRDDEALKMLEPLFNAHPERTAAALSMIKILGKDGNQVKARRIFERAKRFADESNSVVLTAEAELLKSENRHEAAIQILREKKPKDQHTIGMLLECWFHFANNHADPYERARLARQALAENLPESLRWNAPLMVNRARLAALGGDRGLFDGIIKELRASRAETYEIESLLHLWESTNGSFIESNHEIKNPNLSIS